MPVRSPRTSSPPPARVLLGPGPSNVHPRVLARPRHPADRASRPGVHRADGRDQAPAARVFQTTQRAHHSRSPAPAAPGMEACLVNLLEPGDDGVVGVNGVFGTRMADIVERCGAPAGHRRGALGRVIEPGRPSPRPSPRRKRQAGGAGARRDLDRRLAAARGDRPLAHERGALFVVDSRHLARRLSGRASTTGGIDACYSGTQKCLSCPPGLSPVTFGPRALERAARPHAPRCRAGIST